MERFIKFRVQIVIGFAIYVGILVTGYSIYQGNEYNEMMSSLTMILLGFFAGVIEYAIFSGGTGKPDYDYRRFIPIYFGILILVALIGPILMIVFPNDGFELAGVVFIVTGMTLTAKHFKSKDELE